MPYELRFALALFGVAIVAGAASTFGIYRQDSRQTRITAEALAGGGVTAGRTAMARYNCGACHQIPGIAGASGRTGPALAGIGVQAHIAGMLANNPDNLVRWLRHPQQVAPGNGMPELGVTERDARDMAAYLYTLKN